MLHMALIGCGRHGERYLRHLASGEVPGARPVALWRRNGDAARRLAQTYGVEASPDLDALLQREDVDAFLVTTPPACHLPEVRRLLDIGKPFLVEKPLTATLAEADRLLALASDDNAPRTMVAQTLRYHPALQRARDLLPGLGTVHRLRVQQRLEPSDLAWQRDAAVAGGGSVLLTGVHLFDLVRWLVGRTPDSVVCRCLRVEGHPLENLFDACFEYVDEGILAATEVSKFSRSRSSMLEVVGTAGQLHVDYHEGRLWRLQGSEREELEPTGSPPTLPRLLADFSRLARGEIPSPISLHEGREAVAMAEACYRSAREGRRVAVQSPEAAATDTSTSPRQSLRRSER